MATYSLTGSGVQALSTGVGALHITITTPALNEGTGFANPPDHYACGYLRASDGTGFWDPYPVSGGPQWMPLPNGCTQLGYAVIAPGVISVVEVFGSSPLAGSLASLSDVALSSLADAQVLTYSASAGKWINASPASGGGTSLTTARTVLTAAVTLTTANTYYDIMTLSLVAGTWLVLVQMYMDPAASVQMTAKLWDGTNVYASSSQNTTKLEMTYMQTILTLSATTTLRASATNNGNGGSVQPAALFNASGNTASQINAVKLA